jgi:hypothetical protein
MGTTGQNKQIGSINAYENCEITYQFVIVAGA